MAWTSHSPINWGIAGPRPLVQNGPLCLRFEHRGSRAKGASGPQPSWGAFEAMYPRYAGFRHGGSLTSEPPGTYYDYGPWHYLWCMAQGKTKYHHLRPFMVAELW